WELTMDVNRLLKFDNAHPILTKVKSSLANLGYPQLNQIKCEQEGSTVVLKGELASFYMSQLAQTTVSKVPGVVRVENRVTVGPVV
ncbi:MAG: BON domain-containing protein, partial [Planctomycetota bacterium]